MGKEFLPYIIMASSRITDVFTNDSLLLCFQKEEFMNVNFSVDKFVSEHRKNASFETLREDLGTYLRFLRSAMIELINQDYADFVNLSSNLAGLDKSINNLSVPLGQLREEVMAVKDTFSDSLLAAQQQLTRKQEIRRKKMILQRVLAIVEGVDNLEELSQKSIFLPLDQRIHCDAGPEPGTMVERVAMELSQVDSQLKKTPSFTLLNHLMPRLEHIRSTLHQYLERSFLLALEDDGKGSAGKESLRSILRAASCIDHVSALHDLFLRKLVRPYMMEVISEKILHQKGLEYIYQQILEFLNKKCNRLFDTSFSIESSCETRLAFGFLVEVVFPEVVSCLERHTPSVFSPGHPQNFQKHYLASQLFLQNLYALCPTENILCQLKQIPAHTTFLAKWNLLVYYQIRFQEIGGALETAFATPFQEASECSLCLHCSQVLERCLRQCWSRDVILDPLSSRFWKLTLQLLARYSSWVHSIVISAQDRGQVEYKFNNQDLNNGLTEGPAVPHESEPTVKHLVMLVTDLQNLSSKVPSFFDELVKPIVLSQGFRNLDCLKSSLQESTSQLGCLPDRVSDLLVARLVAQCSAHLKMASEIPRLYRKTNREVPTKASTYISLVFQPLEAFELSHAVQIPNTLWSQWRLTVIDQVTEHYLTVTRDVLHSVKKMEDSLKRLKKVRERTPISGGIASGVVTDDDKIRIQFAIDVQNFGAKVELLNLKSTDLSSYSQLVELVESARNTPNS